METKTATKERPIIFNAHSVQAILDGMKTQTRRVVTTATSEPRGLIPLSMDRWLIGGEWQKDDDGRPLWLGRHPDFPTGCKSFSCPYGKPGDRLWVRETWAYVDGEVWYNADGIDFPRDDGVKLKPPTHMPKWASRLTLEVTAVRVERLQDITEWDADREGIDQYSYGRAGMIWLNGPDGETTREPVTAFSWAWDTVNGRKHPWDSNPWVFVVEFKRVQ